MPMPVKNILIINGSLGGSNGNTSVLIETAIKYLTSFHAKIEVLHLEEFFQAQKPNHTSEANEILGKKLLNADGLIFTSGTYWDSWGSPMQKFLELATQFEASDYLLFKPACVMISMHSAGGKGVLSRLQGVLNTMGMTIPPMCGLVYSLTAHLALQNTENQSDFNDDFWSLEDIEVVIHNLVTALHYNKNFKSWPIDKKDPKRRWL